MMNRRVGPLALWGWGLALVGGIIAWRIIERPTTLPVVATTPSFDASGLIAQGPVRNIVGPWADNPGSSSSESVAPTLPVAGPGMYLSVPIDATQYGG